MAVAIQANIMTFEQYRQHDALGLAQLVKNGDVRAEDLLEVAIGQVEAKNPTINAVIHKMYEAARATATQVDKNAPFAGVPFVVKDLGVELKGEPMRLGCRGWQGYISPADTYVAQRMRRAGLLIFAKTNTPEFGLNPFTEPELFGPSRNPHNPEHSTGGSSGGSAACVGAGIVPIASANDGGGSIRIPASCCGLFGLKPTRGRVSWGPAIGVMWNGAAVENCVSRSVRDSAAYLDAIQGMEPGDPYGLPEPKRPYLEEVSQEPGKLRIGYFHATPGNTPVDPACIQALEKMVATLRDLGHTVEETPSPYLLTDLTETFLSMVTAETAAALELLSKHLGRRVRPGDVEPNTYALALLGRRWRSTRYAMSQVGFNDLSRRIANWHNRYDLMLTPTLGYRPFKIGALQNTAAENTLLSIVNPLGLGWAVEKSIDQLAEKIYGFMPWTAFANITGQPSMNIPTLRTVEEGLPIGTMFTAPMCREDLLLRLAGQLERHGAFG